MSLKIHNDEDIYFLKEAKYNKITNNKDEINSCNMFIIKVPTPVD